MILSGIFLTGAAQLHAFSAALAVLILAYTFAPVICAFLVRRSAPPVWMDFVIIALLWFPLEFSLGQSFIAKRAQGPLHMAAYGVSILLGLTIFLLFRRLADMKYNLPRTGRDLTNLLIGFAACTRRAHSARARRRLLAAVPRASSERAAESHCNTS